MDLSTGSVRDALVNTVAKAIGTGSRKPGGMSFRDEAFYAGRVSGMVHAAATLAELVYGCQYQNVRRSFTSAIRQARKDLSREERRDAEVVGLLATDIVDEALQEV